MRTIWVRLAVLCALLAAIPAFAGTPLTVDVDGQTYSTGYLGPQPALGGRIYNEEFKNVTFDDLPDRWCAWDLGLVPPIRDQGSCGSCWAHARTRSLEIAKAVAGVAPLPNQTNLAEQDLVANDRSAAGCGGGYMGSDFEKEQGVTTEEVCPYTARNTACRSAGKKDTFAVSWMYIGGRSGPSSDAEVAAAMMKYGSVYNTTAAGGSGYNTDANGNFRSCGSHGINHMTNYTCFEKRGNELWFLMDNSWGTGWGMDGKGWMKRGCNQTAVGSESVAVVTVDGPGPQPAIVLKVPFEVVTTKGVPVHLGVEIQDGVTYSWQDAGVTSSGNMAWIRADKSKVITATAVNSKGARISKTTNIIVQE